MPLNPNELRIKLMRDYPKQDVVYEQRAGGETLQVFPAGSLKKLRAEREKHLDRLQARMPKGFNVRTFPQRHEEDGEESLVIVIEAEEL